MGDDDEGLLRAAERWVQENRDDLVERGVDVRVSRPHDPVGMDPVYVVGLNSEHAEAEASLFRGGTILLAGYVKSTATAMDPWHVDASSPGQVHAALTDLATRV